MNVLKRHIHSGTIEHFKSGCDVRLRLVFEEGLLAPLSQACCRIDNKFGVSRVRDCSVMREARATMVAAAQSSTSFIPPLGEEKADVLTLNLRNRMIFKAADEAGAVQSADFLGQKKIKKPTYGYSGGMHTRTYTEMEEHKIKPYLLRQLRKHQCVLVHCERGFKRTILPPLEPDGKVSSWFKRELF